MLEKRCGMPDVRKSISISSLELKAGLKYRAWMSDMVGGLEEY
jgi:hypothetical protein